MKVTYPKVRKQPFDGIIIDVSDDVFEFDGDSGLSEKAVLQKEAAYLDTDTDTDTDTVTDTLTQTMTR